MGKQYTPRDPKHGKARLAQKFQPKKKTKAWLDVLYTRNVKVAVSRRVRMNWRRKLQDFLGASDAQIIKNHIAERCCPTGQATPALAVAKVP